MYASTPHPHEEIAEENEKEEKAKPPRLSFAQWLVKYSPVDLKWIPANWAWSKVKPVIRCAIVAWISILFVIIPKTEVTLGTASFLILIAAFLQSPAGPFIAVVEQQLLTLFFATVAWAWSCLGLFLANLARKHVDRSATQAEVNTGKFVEAGPTVIQAVFLFFGSAFFLYLKTRMGPGPFLISTILACICLDIVLATGSLFPYANYKLGRSVVVPLAISAGLSILAAAVIFPSTITAQYTHAIARVLDPLETFLTQHRKVLSMDPSSDEFKATVGVIKGLQGRSEAAMAPTAVWLQSLKRDIVWGRFSPADVSTMQWAVRRIVTRAEGMNIYFTLIEPTRERFPVTPAPTVPNTPTFTRQNTPAHSRGTSPVRGLREQQSMNTLNNQEPVPDSTTSVDKRHDGMASTLHTALVRTLRHISRSNLQQHLRHKPSVMHDNRMHLSLLELAHSLGARADTESAVGVYESQRYLALERTRLSNAQTPEMTSEFTELLSQSCDELLAITRDSVTVIKDWVLCVRRADWGSRSVIERMRHERLQKLQGMRNYLHEVIETFRRDARHRVLDPYRSAFDPHHVKRGRTAGTNAPPHKYLFHCYMYEFHALQFSILIKELLDDIIAIENQRQTARLWTPTLRNLLSFVIPTTNGATVVNHDDDEDPDVVQMMEHQPDTDLGMTQRRDPDALPPSNLFESLMYWVHQGFAALGSGNFVFAIKAGLLTVALSLPYRIKSSAHFAYSKATMIFYFMGQLTASRFRGDTTFGLVSRILSTFCGGLTGSVMWYISTGLGTGNPYGLAAVCAVCFPFFFYGKMYWPGSPMFTMIYFVTTILVRVIGFSWQDTHFPTSFIYYGINLAWRRFVLVAAGVTAAFLTSFLPPSTTLRGYHRRTMSTTVTELGAVYCSVVSFANKPNSYEIDRGAIVQSLLAIRLKLKRSLVLRTNIIYEFSLRGKWPAERYQKILEIQLQVGYLLSHLMSVVEQLEPAWRRAFLRRTRFVDADFQGDVLAVISMISTALKTGQPLPQITPCPLLDRYMQNSHGLNVIRHEADDDYGLPRTMTIDTLANEQYLNFSVGCTTAFGIVMRLDRLMVATKELVGEQYHIHGVGAGIHRDYMNAPSSTSMPLRPAKDV
ncbi:hypothetical protein PHLGIDRAFT_493842 [Phlebiopsis gigantea 11061_1 CR5-6]|uniref:ER transporter 6TM N-terminal domain-containing protein n=1 Tax=Phlebiopsis gigantea (strain 11061_1 CR5-6) TaxID=745531 RepID=A0A0C3NHM7_PHLG1|nr:hypothetical protein PHLGIDRAFT_493842 [Phlebiopsis gigantea 11061_1 CR5-6]